MKKKNVHLTSRQVERIEELAEEYNLSFAEMLRRVIDASPEMKQSRFIGEIIYPDDKGNIE